jgi:hypothetical protein
MLTTGEGVTVAAGVSVGAGVSAGVVAEATIDGSGDGSVVGVESSSSPEHPNVRTATKMGRISQRRDGKIKATPD